MKYVFLIIGLATVSVAGYLVVSNNVLALAAFGQDEDRLRPGETADQDLDESKFGDPEYWRGRLTKEQFEVTQEKGTERPFKNAYYDNKKSGVYRCVCCNEPLFDSKTKFESGTGWPSFFAPTEDKKVAEEEDRSAGMVRTEVKCARCDAHLGHVFPWRTQPSGLRYCINSASLTFEELDEDGNPVNEDDEKAGDAKSDDKTEDSVDDEKTDSTKSDEKMTGKKK